MQKGKKCFIYWIGREILKIFSNYLLYSTKQTAVMSLSELLDGDISHDKITKAKPCYEERDDAGDDQTSNTKPG